VLDRDGQHQALPLVTIVPVSEAKVGNVHLEKTLVDNTAERQRTRRCGKWSGSSSREHRRSRPRSRRSLLFPTLWTELDISPLSDIAKTPGYPTIVQDAYTLPNVFGQVLQKVMSTCGL
jgi:hypothetical protein